MRLFSYASMEFAGGYRLLLQLNLMPTYPMFIFLFFLYIMDGLAPRLKSLRSFLSFFIDYTHYDMHYDVDYELVND